MIIGSCYYEKKKYGDSYFYFKNAKNTDPHNYEIYYNVGNVLLKIGKIKKAMECFQKSSKLNPQFIYSYLKLAETLTELKKYEKAIKVFIHFDLRHTRKHFH